MDMEKVSQTRKSRGTAKSHRTESVAKKKKSGWEREANYTLRGWTRASAGKQHGGNAKVKAAWGDFHAEGPCGSRNSKTH